jgi:hypothetical protein
MKFKNKIIKLSLLSLIGAMSLNGCKKSDFAINKNPDSPTDASVLYSEIIPAALQSTSKIVDADWAFLQNYMGYWARSADYQPSVDEETYSFTTSFAPANTIWNDLYANANNYNIAQAKAKAAGAGTYEAIARIMKVHAFQILVDVFGNVPYKQALQGTAYPTPVYDKGIDIYKDLFRQLDSAIITLNTASLTATDKNPQIATADFVYAGNTLKWKKFANTLKLRMLLHVYQVTGFDIAGEMTKINAEGSGFLATGETAQLNPGFTETKPNPYYRAYVKNEAGTVVSNQIRANEYVIDYYKADNDPRIDRFYKTPSAGGAHAGIAYGQAPNSTQGGTKLSSIDGPGIVPNGASSRAWIMTSVESLFLQAEARQRGIITSGASAKTLLDAAMLESFTWLGVKNNYGSTVEVTPATSLATYMSYNAGYPDVDYTAPPLASGLPAGGIYTILSQKWFALNAIATFEVWADYRRTDVVYGIGGGYNPGPPISILSGNTATKLPVRLLYPQTEYNYNPTNVAGEGTVNKFTSKVFWDLN